MRYYSDLLPSYLDGENIQKHSSVIEYIDKKADAKIDLFSIWNKLERPILIQRDAKNTSRIIFTIYINTKDPIKEITIDGEITDTITITNETTTEYNKTYNYTPTTPPGGIMMPQFTVTVETTERTYTKGYPENDTIENNIYDHDPFLDIVGGLLNIPRRNYKAFTGTIGDTTPPYFAKEIIDGVYQACTEDDYYYKERLKGYTTSDKMATAYFQAIYNEGAHLFPKRNEAVPVPLLQEGTIGVSLPLVTAKNIDLTSSEELIRKQLPITREVYLYYKNNIIRSGVVSVLYPNYMEFITTMVLNGSDNVPIAYLPVNVTETNIPYTEMFTTDEEGLLTVTLKGISPGNHTFSLSLAQEYEEYYYISVLGLGGTVSSLFKLSLSDDAWQYKEFSGTTVTDLETPTILDNDDLNCGTGILTYTPAINPALVDLTEYTIEVTFHYTGIGQSILLGTLQETETNAMINGIRTQPREHTHTNPDPTDTHTLTYKFLDNTCYTYYDDTYTGQHQNLTDTTSLIYLAGYNYYTDSENTGTQITEVTATPTVDINTPPEYTGDEIIDLQTTTTKIIPRTDKPTARDPTRTVDGYDLGNWHVPVFKDITVDSNTRNMTITVILDTTLTTGWRIGFAKDNNTSAGWDSTYFLSTNATYTAGEHEITFVCDNTGTWNVLFDGAPSRKQPFTLSTEKNFAAYVSYDTGSIMVRSIRTSTTGASGTGITAETLNSTTGSASIKATLTTSGSGLEGATIQCKNGSTLLTSGTTDSNGECTFDLSSLQAGSYTLTIQYMGDSTYSASSTTHSITITDPTPVTLNLYGKGQSTGWSTTQWTTIEINAAAEAHCNYTKRNAILKQLPLSGDFTLVLHIQASHNTTWNWGLIPSQSDYSNPAMKVSKGDTLNGSTSIATMFDHGGGVWDTTVPVTVTRSGTTYTLEYEGNSYSFTGSTDTLYLWMDKTGSGNLFLTYIETTATMQ